MFNGETDAEWERWGSTDPYFGVLTEEKYRAANLTEETRAEFFRSGERHFAEVLANVRKYLDPGFSPKRVLDFGCGVGRVTIPMARVAESVVGVDVSRSMLREAERNCKSCSIENVELLELSSFLAHPDLFDFIHSYIVFQHIPVSRGEEIFDRLLHCLRERGVCVAHFTYANPKGSRIAKLVRTYVPLGDRVIDVAKGRRQSAPKMQMHAYDLNRLFSMVQAAGCVRVHAEYTDHAGHLGVMLYCRREA